MAIDEIWLSEDDEMDDRGRPKLCGDHAAGSVVRETAAWFSGSSWNCERGDGHGESIRGRAVTTGPLTERFFAEEFSLGLVEVFREVFARRTHGEEYLEFNVFNLRLDFDTRTLTVEDVLDPDSEEQLGLDEFAARVEWEWQRR